MKRKIKSAASSMMILIILFFLHFFFDIISRTSGIIALDQKKPVYTCLGVKKITGATLIGNNDKEINESGLELLDLKTSKISVTQ